MKSSKMYHIAQLAVMQADFIDPEDRLTVLRELMATEDALVGAEFTLGEDKADE